MSHKIELKVIEGQRGELEYQISHALFTVFDQKGLEEELDKIHGKLVPKGRLTSVSDNTQQIR